VCGRYYRKSDKQAIAEHFAANVYDFELKESYNVAPQSTQPVVRVNGDTGEREVALMRWGLVPYWAKDAKVGHSTINAKSETVATNRLFREAFERRRCLVPADGFYEWVRLDPENDKTKQPYGIGLKDGSLHAFAGIWERWKDRATQELLETFSFLTTEPNELTASIHNRMPVILARRDYARWLAPFEAGRPPIDLLRPFAAEKMMVWPVGTAVGNARNDDASLVLPVTKENAGAEPQQPLLW
jgi:putative SOS response-associated peptidase YedK